MHQHHRTSPSPAALRDLTGNAPLREAAQAAMSVAEAIQHVPHNGARLMGAAAAFLIMAERSGLSVPDLMGMARNCISNAEGRRPEFAAVGDFITHEVFSQ